MAPAGRAAWRRRAVALAYALALLCAAARAGHAGAPAGLRAEAEVREVAALRLAGANRLSEKLRVGVATVFFPEPLRLARVNRTDAEQTLLDADALSADQLGALGLARLVCGARLFESHPFPHSLSSSMEAGAPPLFLIPLAHDAPMRNAWSPLHDMLQQGALRRHLGATDRLSFALVLEYIRSAAGAPGAHVLNLDEGDFSKCELRLLSPSAQTLEPRAVLVGERSRRPYFGRMPLSAAAAPSQAARGEGEMAATLVDELAARLWQRLGEELQRNALVSSLPDTGCNDTARDAAARMSLLETKVDMYAAILAQNPVKGIVMPLIEPFAEIVASPVIATFMGILLDKVVSGVTNKVVKQLTERIAPQVSDQIIPVLIQAIPDIVMDLVPWRLAKAVVEESIKRLTEAVTQDVVKRLADTIPARSDSRIAEDMAVGIGPEMTALLVRSLAQTVAPTFKHTLYRTATSVRCYYCQRNEAGTQGMCDGCADQSQLSQHEETNVKDSLYWAGFYSTYYMNYYAQADFRDLERSSEASQPAGDYFHNAMPPGTRERIRENSRPALQKEDV